MMESHGVIFPVLSQNTKMVMVSLFYEAFRAYSFDTIMNGLGIDETERSQVQRELRDLNGFFRRVWPREAFPGNEGLHAVETVPEFEAYRATLPEADRYEVNLDR